MSSTSCTIIRRVKSNLHDPATLLAILQTFRIETVVLAIRITPVNEELAQEILDIARVVELNLEVPLTSIMQKHNICKAYFTGNVTTDDVDKYEEFVVVELQKGLDKIEDNPDWDEKPLGGIYRKAITISVLKEVNEDLDEAQMEGCLDAAHLRVDQNNHIMATICPESGCRGRFVLPEIPDLRHYVNNYQVLEKLDEDWMATQDDHCQPNVSTSRSYSSLTGIKRKRNVSKVVDDEEVSLNDDEA